MLRLQDPLPLILERFARELGLVLQLDLILRDQHREDRDALSLEEPARDGKSGESDPYAHEDEADYAPSTEAGARTAAEGQERVPWPVTEESLRLERVRIVPVARCDQTTKRRPL